jgi:hypothetical protein
MKSNRSREKVRQGRDAELERTRKARELCFKELKQRVMKPPPMMRAGKSQGAEKTKEIQADARMMMLVSGPLAALAASPLAATATSATPTAASPAQHGYDPGCDRIDTQADNV